VEKRETEEVGLSLHQKRSPTGYSLSIGFFLIKYNDKQANFGPQETNKARSKGRILIRPSIGMMIQS
jgi:hypothetical protein